MLKIGCMDNRAWYEHLTFFTKPLSMTVYLPADHYETLKIHNSTGDIRVPASFSFSGIDLQVSTGDIVCDASAEKIVQLKTSTGNVRLSDVRAQQFSLSVSTGNIRLKNTVAADLLDIHSSTGDVRLDNCDAGQIKVKTSTGDVTGTLQSEKIFVTKSSTGSIRVPQTVSGGKCEIITSTGDIEISISDTF